MKALIFSGGGSKGSYQAGVLQYLLGDLEIKYDIVCGISAGAINAAAVAQYKHGEEKKATEDIGNLWLSLDTKSIYKRWFPFGKFHALWRTGLCDASPLHKLVKKHISLEKIRNSGKQVAVGAVCLNSGKYTVFDQHDDFFVEAVVASASFPGIFTPVSIRERFFTDGGIKENISTKTAIEWGATELDLILTSPEIRNKHWIDYPNIGDIIQRSLELSTDKIIANDIEKLLLYNQLAEAKLTDKIPVKLNIIRPEYNLIEDILDFDPIKIKNMMEIGYNDAKNKYII
jgi:NTE family protein